MPFPGDGRLGLTPEPLPGQISRLVGIEQAGGRFVVLDIPKAKLGAVTARLKSHLYVRHSREMLS